MTKEQLEKAEELQSAIKSWQSRKNAIDCEADRVSLTHCTGIVHGSFDLNDEENKIIKEALVKYYDSKIAPLQEEFEKL